MVTIAHISDTHLGHRPTTGVKFEWIEERKIRLIENDFYDAWKKILKEISDRKDEIDLIIHAGDLFDSPWDRNPHPPPEVARELVYKTLKEFFEETKIPMVVIDGNHGSFMGYRSSTLDTLKIVFEDYIFAATTWDLRTALIKKIPLKFKIKDTNIYAFPYINPDILRKSQATELFNAWIVNIQKPEIGEGPNIAVAHGMILDNTLNKRILELDYDYIALGHNHKMEKLSENAWYAGSTERWRFDEYEDEKGFLIVQVEEGEKPLIRKIPIKSPRPMIVDKIKIDTSDTPENIKNTVLSKLAEYGLQSGWDPFTAARVKVVFEGRTLMSSLWKINSMLEYLRKQLFEDNKFNIAQFVWDWKNVEKTWTAPAYIAEEKEYLIEDPEKDFKEFLKTQKIEEGYDINLLVKLAAKAIKEALGKPSEDKISKEVQKASEKTPKKEIKRVMPKKGTLDEFL
ncbi:MAG: DNA repair exonuclease [Candidatus Odinarchaeota archaeon]|nr:DNA repair exonuclease [Candidatus Odinarchaeota archaeon]